MTKNETPKVIQKTKSQCLQIAWVKCDQAMDYLRTVSIQVENDPDVLKNVLAVIEKVEASQEAVMAAVNAPR